MAERSPEIEQRIIEGLSQGIPLAVLCREDGMPYDRAVRYWMEQDEVFASAIACARETGFDVIAADGLKIVDNLDEDPASRRVRSDYRLKLLAKWDPKRYGDKTLIGSDPENPLPSGFDVRLHGSPTS